MLVNNLFIFGDSHSYGFEISEDLNACEQLCYGMHLKKILKAKNYYNFSVPGASNYYISNSILKELDDLCDYENSVIIIGWSEPNRFIFDINKDNNLIHIGPTSYQAPWTPASYDEFYKKSKEEQKNEFLKRFKNHTVFYAAECLIKNYFYTDFCYTTDILLRLSISKFLESKNAKFFTFSALNEEQCSNYKTISQLFNNNNILSIRDKFDFLGLLGKNGECLAPSLVHLNALGHINAAKWIYDELLKRNIIN